MALVAPKNGRPDSRRFAAICILVAFFVTAVWMAVPKSESSHGSAKPGSGSGSESALTNFNKVAVPGAKIDDQLLKEAAPADNTDSLSDSLPDSSEDAKADAESEELKASTEFEPDSEFRAGELEEAKGSKEAEEAASAAELTVENTEMEGSLTTQAKESVEEREASITNTEWKMCSSSAGADYIPCLDNTKAMKKLKSTKHYEHRERHCPADDESRLCLVPLPSGYKPHIPWPRSRNEIWYNNVPHTGLVSYKADQKWVVKKDDVLVFPGGGTQFKKGATRYIEFVEKTLPAISWGKHTRVILDVGCGVASFGGYLFDKDVLTMSFAPKDEHEAQVQFALERGIPAISAVMGTTRLPFPSNVYDAVHCARCRVPWHVEGAKLLVELNRVLRPGGYFIWSATPVYQREAEDVEIWKATTAAATKLCWKRLARTRDPLTGIGVAVFQKPLSNDCYRERSTPMCEDSDSGDSAWYEPLGTCVHEIHQAQTEWPEEWPSRLEAVPKGSAAAAKDFHSDSERWKDVVHNSYERKLGIDWDGVRNVMDMRAGFGGFAAALASLPVWVMNVVPVSETDTLPIIFHRGLFGIYHDWCESFSTYPRTYDLVHADNLFSQLGEKSSCKATHVLLEMDRIVRPEGWAIIRDNAEALTEVEAVLKSLYWEVKSKGEELLVAQKKMWRPEASI